MLTLFTLKPEKENARLLALGDDEKNVFVDGRQCPLTQQEFYLLQELAQHVGRTVSREHLLRTAWGYLSPGETRTVDVHVQRLRKKLGFSSIETVYRLGYKLKAFAL